MALPTTTAAPNLYGGRTSAAAAAAAAAAAGNYPPLGGAPRGSPRPVCSDGAAAAVGLRARRLGGGASAVGGGGARVAGTRVVLCGRETDRGPAAAAPVGRTIVLPGPSTTLSAPPSSSEQEEVGASPSRRPQRRAAAAAAASISPSSSSPPQPPQPPLYPPHLSLLALAVAPNARALADHLDSNRKQGAMFFAAASHGPLGASARETEARAAARGLPALASKNVRGNARKQGECPGGFLRVSSGPPGGGGVGGGGGGSGGRELIVVCRILEGAEEVPAARAALEARLQIAMARRRAGE